MIVLNIKGSNALSHDFKEDALLFKYIDTEAFNEISDQRAIDYASYNLLAARAKYSYLLKLAKEKKLSL